MTQEESLADFLLAQVEAHESRLLSDFGTDFSGWHTRECCYEGGYEGTHRCDCGAVERRLAECEAKRRIIASHAPDRWDCRACADEEDFSEDSEGERTYYRQAKRYPCLTLRLLALPYAEHPAFRQEWKP